MRWRGVYKATTEKKRMRQKLDWKGDEVPQRWLCTECPIWWWHAWRCAGATVLVVISVSLKPALLVKSMCLIASEGPAPFGVLEHTLNGFAAWRVQDLCRERPPSASVQDGILQTYPRAHGSFAQWENAPFQPASPKKPDHLRDPSPGFLIRYSNHTHTKLCITIKINNVIKSHLGKISSCLY